MTIPQEMYAPLATGIAAFIAAVATLVSLIVSKENKISDFRHLWIQEVRNHLSEILSATQNISAWRQAHEIKGITENNFLEVFGTVEEHYSKIFHSISQVLLRLNAKEHKELIRLLEDLGNKVSDAEHFLLQPKAVSNQVTLVINESQKVLKTEWEVVKKGETAFVSLKNTSKIIAIALSLVGILVLVITLCS
jgi:hypothetical protein